MMDLTGHNQHLEVLPSEDPAHIFHWATWKEKEQSNIEQNFIFGLWRRKSGLLILLFLRFDAGDQARDRRRKAAAEAARGDAGDAAVMTL